MEAKLIKTKITNHIKKSMGSKNPILKKWYVGITNDEKRRNAEHRTRLIDIKHWKCFDAETLLNANQIEAYFSELGTSNLPSKNGANKTSTYVYVFKKPFTKPSGLNGAFTDKNIIDFLFE